MVCSRGESLTHRFNQMKLFNAITVAAIIGTSLVAPSKAKSSVYIDLYQGQLTGRNDGDPTLTLCAPTSNESQHGDCDIVKLKSKSAANPFPNRGHNERYGYSLPKSEMQNYWRLFHQNK